MTPASTVSNESPATFQSLSTRLPRGFGQLLSALLGVAGTGPDAGLPRREEGSDGRATDPAVSGDTGTTAATGPARVAAANAVARAVGDASVRAELTGDTGATAATASLLVAAANVDARAVGDASATTEASIRDSTNLSGCQAPSGSAMLTNVAGPAFGAAVPLRGSPPREITATNLAGSGTGAAPPAHRMAHGWHRSPGRALALGRSIHAAASVGVPVVAGGANSGTGTAWRFESSTPPSGSIPPDPRPALGGERGGPGQASDPPRILAAGQSAAGAGGAVEERFYGRILTPQVVADSGETTRGGRATAALRPAGDETAQTEAVASSPNGTAPDRIPLAPRNESAPEARHPSPRTETAQPAPAPAPTVARLHRTRGEAGPNSPAAPAAEERSPTAPGSSTARPEGLPNETALDSRATPAREQRSPTAPGSSAALPEHASNAAALARSGQASGISAGVPAATQVSFAVRAADLITALVGQGPGNNPESGVGTDRPRSNPRERIGASAPIGTASDPKPGDTAAPLGGGPAVTGSPGEASKAAGPSSSDTARPPMPPWSAEAFAELRAALTAEGRGLRLDLDPEDLGRLSLRLELVDENIRASLVAESEGTLALLDAERGALDRLLGGRTELRFELAGGGDDSQRGARRDPSASAEPAPTRTSARAPAEPEFAPADDALAPRPPRHVHQRISVRA